MGGHGPTIVLAAAFMLAAAVLPAAEAHGYMMVCQLNAPSSVRIPTASPFWFIKHDSLPRCCHFPFRQPIRQPVCLHLPPCRCSLFHRMLHAQVPMARNWLVAGQRYKNYYSPYNFYQPMNLNRWECRPDDE